MIERELLPTRAAMADELADMLRVVLAKWTPGNPARLSHVRALLARYDALPDAAQLDADRRMVAARGTGATYDAARPQPHPVVWEDK